MNQKKHIFCALDFSDLKKTLEFTNIIKDYVGGIKLGLEFFCKYGPNGIEQLKKFSLPIFLDLKLHDIPNTVKATVRNLMDLSPEYLTVHISGGSEMINELNEIKKKTKIIGVTMLTSLNKLDLKEFGIDLDEQTYVNNLVSVGIKSGIDGIVASPIEIKNIKLNFNNLIYVTPGIRLPNQSIDDQKRVNTPGFAIKSGASILVIGRPITQSQNPISTINQILLNIDNEKKIKD